LYSQAIVNEKGPMNTGEGAGEGAGQGAGDGSIAQPESF
jgi:hypothetical protein